MNISYGKTKELKLRPKVKVPTNIVSKVDADKMDFVMNHKSRQFVLESGVIMARIDSVIENVFSLGYHFRSTKSFDEFINSINYGLSVIDKKLSTIDISKLRIDYNNKIRKMVENKSISQQFVNDLT